MQPELFPTIDQSAKARTLTRHITESFTHHPAPKTKAHLLENHIINRTRAVNAKLQAGAINHTQAETELEKLIELAETADVSEPTQPQEESPLLLPPEEIGLLL
jgi:hypothetical protein